MTWIQYWIPFVGFRPIPDNVAEIVGLDGAPTTKYKGFTLSWLGYNLILSVKQIPNEQEQV